jgi:hypothetical protein
MVLAKMRETAEQYLNTKVKWVLFYFFKVVR